MFITLYMALPRLTQYKIIFSRPFHDIGMKYKQSIGYHPIKCFTSCYTNTQYKILFVVYNNHCLCVLGYLFFNSRHEQQDIKCKDLSDHIINGHHEKHMLQSKK